MKTKKEKQKKAAIADVRSVERSTNDDLPDPFDDEYDEESPLESCPKCGETYDDADYDFQRCWKCGWDAEEQRYFK